MSDTDSDSASSDPRDLDDESEQDEIADQGLSTSGEDGRVPNGTGQDDASKKDGEDGEPEPAPAPDPPPESPKYGLLYELEPPQEWQTYDVVLVHSIRKTSWTAPNEWKQGDGSKSSSYWVSSEMGFSTGRFLHFHYDYRDTVDEGRPDIMHRGGIDQQAQVLIDALLEFRQKFDAEVAQNDSVVASRRGLVFIGHDIGGIIIKKALTLAAHNPAKYGDIPFNTTHLVFLGTPHRGIRNMIEDEVAKLLLLTEDSFQNYAVEATQVLAQTIMETSEEFLDTKVLLHASVYNIVNRGAGPDGHICMPWNDSLCYYNIPYEYSKITYIPHLKLADGDSSAGNDGDKFTNDISRKLGTFPFHINPSSSLAPLQKTFLSMSPPVRPSRTNNFGWQPYDYNPWVAEQDQYKRWSRRRASGVLHIRGPSPMRLFSEKFWDYLLGYVESLDDPLHKDIALFVFSRADSRFNSVDKLLAFMIANIVSRNEDIQEAASIFDMMAKQRAWTTKDLAQIFISCYDIPKLRPMGFMIACLDECDDSIRVLLDLITELHNLSEKPFRFIFSTTAGASRQLDEALAPWPTIDLADFPKAGNEWNLDTDRRYEFYLKRLLEKKPIYARFQGQLREVLSQWGPEDRVGDMVIRWLSDADQDNSRSGVVKTLAGLEGADFTSFLETVVASFGARQSRARSILSWVKHVFEPLTVFELGVAVELSEGTSEEDLDDVFFDEIAGDVKQLLPAIPPSDYEIDFRWFWSDWRRPTPEEAATAHGEIASLCLRYLTLTTVIQKAQEICDRSVSLDQTPLTRPRRDLISYAALYWPKHYALAGRDQPKQEAAAFFENEPARNAWLGIRYAFSNHMARLNRSYLSPLPVVAMTGLDDLVAAQIESERSSLTFHVDAALALVEAVRNGHFATARLILEAQEPNRGDLRDAISAAAAVGDETMLRHLVELAAQVEEFEWPSGLLARAAWLGLVDVAKRLLDLGVKGPEPMGTFESSLLHLAIEARHKDIVRLLLDANYDVEVKDESGHTPLAHAASQGCPEIIRMLLRAGADPEVADEDGIKPIQRSITNAKPKALRALLEGGAKMEVGADEVADPIEDTIKANPLTVAAINGYTECVRALLDHGADVKATLDKRTALWHAAFRGHMGVSRLLLDNGADPNENPEEYDLLLVAVIGSEHLNSTETIDFTKLLVEHGARVDEQVTDKVYRSNALCRAAGTAIKELVEYLLDKGAPVDLGAGVTETALWVACFDRREDIVDLLIGRGADVNITSTGGWTGGWTPLHAAYDVPNIVKTLLSHGALINKMSDTASVIYLVSKFNQVEVLKLLLDHSTKPDLELQCTSKPDVGIYDYEDGMTPLCIACKNGHVEVMRLLLQNGANPNHKTKDGSFPLEFCLDTDAEDPGPVMETLLEFRPDLTQSDNEGNTVLHNISSKTPLAVVKMLYTTGADIYATNKAGKTPLTLAVESGNAELAKFLIEKNADVNVYNPETGTILHAIVERDGAGQWDMFDAAVKAGADVHLAHRRGYRETLLHTAMSGYWSDDREKIVRYLLEVAKVDPNERCNDELWYYPLIKCADTQYANAIKLLLEHGAEPNIEDPQGRRPIHVAAYRYWDIVAPLIEGGADPLPRAKSGMTPLHFAAANASNFSETLKNLRAVVEGERTDSSDTNKSPKAKIDINDKDADGWTLIMWLAKGNYSNTAPIQEAVEEGADLWVKVFAVDASGRDRTWSPVKAARYYGSSDEVCEALTPKEKTRTLPDGRTETWDDEVHQTRIADFKSGWTCDHCLMTIAGLNWKCRNCTFNVCYKCARSRHLIHPSHEFEAEGPEFTPLPDLTPEKSGTPTEDTPTPFNGDGRHTESDNLSDDDDDDGVDDDDDDDDTLSNDSD